MHEPIVFLNGRYLPAAQGVLPWSDAGFVMGATVSEQLRTFRGLLYRFDEHFDRFLRSLAIVGIDLQHDRAAWRAHAEHVVAAHREQFEPDDDLGLAWFATPGPYPSFAPDAPREPTLAMHAYPLPFHAWSEKYTTGDRLTTVSIRQAPTSCWPAEIKCRSRMHYHLAQREAQERSPGSRPLLLDEDGQVNETPTANVLAWIEGQGIVSPPESRILPGISRAVVREYAARWNWPWLERPLALDELRAADEVWLTSTPFGILPVTQLDARPVSDGRPGGRFRRLVDAWSHDVGVDLVVQAERYSQRRHV